MKVELSHLDEMKNKPGIPGFWLQAFKNHKRLAGMIQEKDENALKYLMDVRSKKHNVGHGFSLLFYFDTNEYFDNSILEKQYFLEQQSVLKKTEGTEI